METNDPAKCTVEDIFELKDDGKKIKGFKTNGVYYTYPSSGAFITNTET